MIHVSENQLDLLLNHVYDILPGLAERNFRREVTEMHSAGESPNYIYRAAVYRLADFILYSNS